MILPFECDTSENSIIGYIFWITRGFLFVIAIGNHSGLSNKLLVLFYIKQFRIL